MANTKVIIDTVGLGIPWSLNETYRVAVDQGFVQQAGGLQLPLNGNTSILSFSTPANPPGIAVYNPSVAGRMANSSQTIGFTLDRKTLSSTTPGNVYLYKSSGNVLVKTFPISNASITSGNVVALNIVGNVEASTDYYVTANANIFVDRDGFKFPGISSGNVFYFTSPYPPSIQTLYPANNTIAANSIQNITITFDRPITATSGNVFIHNANTNAIINKYVIGTNVTVGGTALTVNIENLLNNGVYYYVKTDANILVDSTLIKFPGISDTTTFGFKAPLAPTLVSTVPANGTQITNGNISITLDRNIYNNSGNIQLFDANTNALINAWTIGTNATISTNTVTANLYNLVEPSKNYYVKTNVHPVRDITGIKFAGITSSNVMTFNTPIIPQLVNTYPINGNVSNMENQTIYLTLDRNVFPNTGNVNIYNTSNVLIKTYDVNNLTFNGANVNVSIAGVMLNPNTSYYVTTTTNSISDSLGLDFDITTSNIFSWTNSVNFSRDWPNNFYLGNTSIISGTSYSANNYSLIIRSINNIDNITSNSSLGGTFNWSLSSDFANISTPQGYNGSGCGPLTGAGAGGGGAGSAASTRFGGSGKTLNFTGTSILYGMGGTTYSWTDPYNYTPLAAPIANRGFGGNIGNPGGSGIVILKYIASDSEVSVATGGAITSSDNYTIHTFTSNGTFTISSTTDTIVEYLIVGGGGASGNTSYYVPYGTDTSLPGGGGGAGGVVLGAAEIESGSYDVVVGNGGALTINRGTNGGNSSVFNVIAYGGGGGGGGNSSSTTTSTGSSGGSGGGAGLNAQSFYSGGSAVNSPYVYTIGRCTITGNLQQLNNHLNNLSWTTIASTTSPYNLNYKLTNGNNEISYRTIPNN